MSATESASAPPSHQIPSPEDSESLKPPPESPPPLPSPPKQPQSPLLPFTALTICIFLVALDTVILPTALPTISHDFRIPNSLYAWTGSAYLLANAASVPFWGNLSDIFGRKPIATAANILFLSGSIVCGVSPNAGVLVTGRAVQGFGAGGVVVLVHICVADMFSLRERSFYLGIIGSVWAVASALGPVLGGIFAQKLNWRWCFYINLPFVSVAAGVLFFTLNLPNSRTPFLAGLQAIDWLGSATISLATMLLLIGLQSGGQTHPWNSPTVICFIILGVCFYALFFVTQWKLSPNPIMPLRIFNDRSNLSALGVCACDALVFNSVAYFLPLYFQAVLKASPSQSGVWMLSLAIPLAIVSLAAGYIMNATGRYLEVLRAGMGIMTLGVGLFISFNPYRNWAQLIAFLIVVGIGFGPNFHAPLIALQTRVTANDMAAGTATFGFVRMVSGAIGVVMGQVVFQSQMKNHLSSFRSLGIAEALAQKLAGGDAIFAFVEVATLPLVQQDHVAGIITTSLRASWIFFTAVSAVGVLISFGIVKEKLTRHMPLIRIQSHGEGLPSDLESSVKEGEK